MLKYRIDLTGEAEDDEVTIRRNGRWPKYAEIIKTLQSTPFEDTPGQHFERLKGDLKGYCSRRINLQNRVIYTVDNDAEGATDEHGNPYRGIVRIYRAWGHDYAGLLS